MLRFQPILAAVTWLGGSALCLGQDRVLPIPSTVQVRVVTGVPFSAQAASESTQVLADGNRIVRKSAASIARDSYGRTRRQQGIAGGASIIFIQDPVASAGYVVDPRTKTARRMVVTGGDGKGTQPTLNRSESLGIQVIENILTEGTRITRTLAPGEAGNESSLEIVTEAWYSSELQTMVMTRTIDPRLGETVYKLTGVQRGEPDHSLFEVPRDYSVKDESPGPQSKETANRLRRPPKPEKPKKPK